MTLLQAHALAFASLAVAWAVIFAGVPANPGRDGNRLAAGALILVALFTLVCIAFLAVDSS